MLDFPDNPVLDEIFITAKAQFKWKGDGRWKRFDPAAPGDPVLILILPNPVQLSQGVQNLIFTGTDFRDNSKIVVNSTVYEDTFLTDVGELYLANFDPAPHGTGMQVATVKTDDLISNEVEFEIV
jgi:hypothetical protein